MNSRKINQIKQQTFIIPLRMEGEALVKATSYEAALADVRNTLAHIHMMLMDYGSSRSNVQMQRTVEVLGPIGRRKTRRQVVQQVADVDGR